MWAELLKHENGTECPTNESRDLYFCSEQPVAHLQRLRFKRNGCVGSFRSSVGEIPPTVHINAECSFFLI